MLADVRQAGMRRAPYLWLALFSAAFLYFLNLGESHFTYPVQIVAGWAVLMAMLVMHRLKPCRSAPWRIVMILLSAYLALRYIWWRTFETLIYSGLADFIGMALLYLAELYGLALHILGMFVNFWPVEHRPVALPRDSSTWPTVDVFIPTYNESEDLVRTTVTAAAQIDYPRDKMRIHILDDGGTSAKRNDPASSESAWRRRYRLMKIAREAGATYITRENNRFAKAGNLNHALRHTSGELVLILDCDHVPATDILRHTVGHFLVDEELCLVQTPHFFINPGPPEKALAGAGPLPDEGDMFYRVIHQGLDSWNASYFCGSAAVLRRRHLEAVGGIAEDSITEDAETGFRLHARGYNSVYITRPMICGLSPESYGDYVIQRTRWAQGMVQIMFLNNPLFARGLTLPQRLCYFNSSLFWFFGLARITYYLAPAGFLIFGLSIYHASWLQVLAYAIPYVLSSLLLMDFFYSLARRPIFSEIYESLQSIFLIPGVLAAVADPRKPTFKVTPKGTTIAGDYLNPLSIMIFAIILVNAVSFTLGIFRWLAYPEYRDVIAVTVAWCLYNIFLAVSSVGAYWERRQIRRNPRITASGRVDVYFPRIGRHFEAQLTDKSLNGVGFTFKPGFAVRNRDDLVIEATNSEGRRYRFDAIVQRAVARGETCTCGVEFLPGAGVFPEAVSFLYGDSENWIENWEQKANARGTVRILALLFAKGLKGCVLSFGTIWHLGVAFARRAGTAGRVRIVDADSALAGLRPAPQVALRKRA